MDLKELQKKVIEFRDARDCGQYHNPKDLAISLMLEAASIFRRFQAVSSTRSAYGFSI
jgi:hypothetical protein